MRFAAPLLCAASLLSFPAAAATLTYSYHTDLTLKQYPFQSYFQFDHDIPRLDPTIGVLKSLTQTVNMTYFVNVDYDGSQIISSNVANYGEFKLTAVLFPGLDPGFQVINESYGFLVGRGDVGTFHAGGTINKTRTVYGPFEPRDYAAPGLWQESIFGNFWLYNEYNHNGIAKITTTGGASIDYSLTVEYDPAAVPEPATWAMMIAGFALVGAASRRGRRRVTV